MEDYEIVELYWDRNEDAITQSSRKYGSYCGKIAYNILYNRSDSEECVNDTWVQAWGAIPPHRPEILRTFLGKITRNLALNLFEKQHTAGRGNGETPIALDELAEVIGAAGNAEDNISLSVLTDSIRRFLRHEKEETRKIFVQRYWYMFSVKEIARANRISESKVKMSLARTREKLRDQLIEDGFAI